MGKAVKWPWWAEGLTGLSVFMGGESTANQVVVQTAGSAFRIPAHAVKQEIEQCTAVSSMMLHCLKALMAQVAHTAACHRFHCVDQFGDRPCALGRTRTVAALERQADTKPNRQA
jgi:hypothetical protein